MKKILSIILSAFMLITLSSQGVTASEDLNLPDGYKVSLEAYHETDNKLSSADACVVEEGVIKKENNKTMLYISLTDNGSASMKGYLNNINYYKTIADYKNKVKTDVNIISTNDLGYPSEISIELTSNVNTIYLGFSIAIPTMPNFNMQHVARLIINDSNFGDPSEEDEKTEEESTALDLEDGKYSIPVSFVKTNSEEESKANATLEPQGEIVVENGVAKVNLKLKKMTFAGVDSWITNMWYYKNTEEYNAGTKNNVEVVSTIEGTSYPQVVSINLDSKSEYLYLTTETSDNYHSLTDIRLKLDYNNLKPASDNLYEDGIYEVNVELLHASNNQPSMANDSLIKTAKMKITNGVGKIYIQTKPLVMGTITASLQTLQYENLDGTYSYAEITSKSEDGNPTGFSFILPSFDEILSIKVNPMVDMMGNMDIAARLKVDYSTLVKLSDDTQLPDGNLGTGEDVVNKTEVTTNTEGISGAVTETGDKSLVKIISILLVSLAAVTVVGIQQRKNKGVV